MFQFDKTILRLTLSCNMHVCWPDFDEASLDKLDAILMSTLQSKSTSFGNMSEIIKH